MTNDDITVTRRDPIPGTALPYSTSISTGRPTDHLTLMCLECVAVGGIEADGLDDIHRFTGLSHRQFRICMGRLERAGIIVTRDLGDHVEISLDGRSIVLKRLRSEARDDPWLVMKAKVFASKGAQCHYCGRDASHVDHVLPRSRGGRDTLENLVPSCARCNLSKGSRTPEEWRS